MKASKIAAGIGLAVALAVSGLAVGHAPKATGAERGADSHLLIPSLPVAKVSEAPSSETPNETPREIELARNLLLGVQGELRDFTPFTVEGESRPEVFEQLAKVFAPPVVTWKTKTPVAAAAVAPDPRLIDLMMRISQELGGTPLMIVSGARKPGKGTSHRSYHVRGMAVDIAVDGVKPIDVRKAALRAGAAGVGLYPRFVHVDVRDVPFKWGAGGRRK